MTHLEKYRQKLKKCVAKGEVSADMIIDETCEAILKDVKELPVAMESNFRGKAVFISDIKQLLRGEDAQAN